MDVNYKSDPGTYSVKAIAQGSNYTWIGTATIVNGQCNSIELTKPVSVNPVPSGYDSQGTITVKSKNITISVYDGADIDHDIITMIFNGQAFVQNLEITGVKKTYTINNIPNNSWLGIIAVSEGTEPPCTPNIEINDGFSTQRFVIRSYINKPGAYALKVQL